MDNSRELELLLQEAASNLRLGVIDTLDRAKQNLSESDYRRELLRIAWVSRANTSGPAHSTTNLTQGIWRQEALDRLHREMCGLT